MHLKAQVPDDILNYWLVQLASEEAEDSDMEILQNTIEAIYSNKLDLNRSDLHHLLSCPLLTKEQAYEINNYKQQFEILSIYELQRMASLTRSDLIHLRPFLYFNGDNLKDPQQHGHELTSSCRFTSPASKGQIENSYAGNRIKFQFRYRFRSQRLKLEFRTEKDAGERLFPKHRRPLEFTSWYIDYNLSKHLPKIIIGDFSVNAGQGLSIYTGLKYGGSSGIAHLKAPSQGIQAYKSFRESAMLRGVAFRIKRGQLELDLYASQKKKDISLNKGTFSSINESGLHRTEKELEKVNQLKDRLIGLNCSYKTSVGNIGATLYHRSFDKKQIPRQKLYQYFRLEANAYSKSSIYFDIAHRHHNIFGEVSTRIGQFQPSWILGYWNNIRNKVDLSILMRNYSKHYIHYLSQAFSNSTVKGGEQGVNIGLSIGSIWNANLDLYKYNWLRYQLNTVSYGHKWQLQYKLRKRKQYDLHLRMGSRSIYEDSLSHGNKRFYQLSKHNARIHLNAYVTNKLELRTRIEANIINTEPVTRGAIIYQEVISKHFFNTLNISFRIAHVIVNSYNNRLYSFERVAFSQNPLSMYHISGTYMYILIRYRINKKLKAWIKLGSDVFEISRRNYNQKFSYGSSYEARIGNIKNTFAFQLRYRLE